MADISKIIAPKSDQLNSDDLATGDRTIHIREVKVLGAGKEQPIWVYFDGDDGKPWKPCKTMARLLADLWRAPDTSTWVGRSVTLYRDPDVTWAGAKIGGIRVRAVSHIDAPRQVAISESKQRRKLATINVITAEVRQLAPQAIAIKAKTPGEWVDKFTAHVNEAPDAAALNALVAEQIEWLDKLPADLRTKADGAVSDKLAAFFPSEASADTDHGDQHDGIDPGDWEK